jgi:serine/threonine protein phosphatase PrpC
MNLFSRKRPSESNEAPAAAPGVAPALPSSAAQDVGSVSSHIDAEFPDVQAGQDEVDANPVQSNPDDDLIAAAFSDDPPPVQGDVDIVDVDTVDEAAPADAFETGPPRALFPGSFLGGEYEIKEVLLRGHFNFYLADASDYGSHDWKLVGERLAMGEEAYDGPDDAFFPPASRFMQEDREYAVWDFQNLKPLDEWKAHPNDETYFHVLGSLARGFVALEAASLQPDLPREALFLDASGRLKAFTFFDAVSEAGQGMTAMQQLAALSSRFAKTNLAAGATLRLDDEFGALPFSEEVKRFARALADGEFASVGDVAAALEGMTPFTKTNAALLTDVGMERELNEDCGLLWKSSRAGHSRNFELELLAVSDGMGGHEGGEVASDLTLFSLEAALVKRIGLDFADNAVVMEALGEVLVEVNATVVGLTENPPYASMRNKPGATLVCALRVGSRVFVGNVGDSRAYRWNERTGLERLTKDHSYVQDLVDNGAITDDEAWGHPDGSIITSHIGMMRGMKRDVFLRLLSAGDRLVLVSDGVVDTLRDSEIEQIIAANADPHQLSVALVNAANDAGGFDNITVATLICE